MILFATTVSLRLIMAVLCFGGTRIAAWFKHHSAAVKGILKQPSLPSVLTMAPETSSTTET